VKIRQNQGIELVLDIIKRFPQNSEVVGYSCGALRGLTFIRECCLTSILCSEHHQLNNLFFFFCISFLSPATNESRTRIALLGGIDLVLEAMNTHPDSTVLQENACALLQNLAGNGFHSPT
jgi:hypothetical protein